MSGRSFTSFLVYLLAKGEARDSYNSVRDFRGLCVGD